MKPICGISVETQVGQLVSRDLHRSQQFTRLMEQEKAESCTLALAMVEKSREQLDTVPEELNEVMAGEEHVSLMCR